MEMYKLLVTALVIMPTTTWNMNRQKKKSIMVVRAWNSYVVQHTRRESQPSPIGNLNQKLSPRLRASSNEIGEGDNEGKKTIQHGEIESLGISAIREFETQQQQIDQSETKRRLGNWKWQLFQFKWIIVDTGRGVVAKRTGDTTSAASYVRFMFPYRCPWLIDGVHEHVQNRCTVTTFLLSPR